MTCGQDLLQQLETAEPDIESLHSFLFSLLTVKSDTLEMSKWNSPIESFIAAFCMRTYQCFKHPKDLTPYLARLKYAFKCVFFKQTVDQVELGAEKSFSKVAEKLCANYMCLTKLNCFSMLSELDTYTSAAAYGTPSHASISWNEDMTAVTYHDQTLELPQLRIGLQKACDRMEELMEEMYLGHGMKVEIPGDLVDDMSNDHFGYSYISQIKSIPDNYLLKKIMEDPATHMSYVDEAGQTRLNKMTAYEWMVKAAELNSHITFILHLTSGQVGRGTEVSDIRINNREMLRNFMLVHGKLMYILNYSKTSNLQNEETYLPHQLCQRLQDSMHQYLGLIRPMEALLAHQLHGNDAYNLYQEFFMVQHTKKLDSNAFSALLAKYTEQYFNVSLKLLAIRHMWIAIKREYIPALFWNHERGNEVGDLLSGHSTATANRLYAVKDGQQTTTSMLILCAQFSRRWHDLMGLGKNPPGLPLLLQRTTCTCYGQQHHVSHMFTTAQPFDDVNRNPVQATLPPAPSVATAPLDLNPIIQAMQIQMNQQQEKMMLQMQQMEKRMETAIIKAVAIAINQAPHHPPPQPVIVPLAPIPTAHFEPLQSIDEEMQVEPEQFAPSQMEDTATYMLQGMSMVYTDGKEDLEWKSEGQKALVCSTLTSNENVLGVLPTGGGKSAVFEVIAHLLGKEKNEVTMVICPYKALLHQFLEQNKNKTACAQWNGTKDSSIECQAANLVFVSADQVKRTDFIQ